MKIVECRVALLWLGACSCAIALAANERIASPHTVATDCDYCPVTIAIPAGSFRMGDTPANGGNDARPVRNVEVPQFAIGRYEVTFAEFDAYVAATGARQPPDQSWGRDDRPVINVSWNEAVAYTQWLSQTTGSRYRLPTESEWQYAALAGQSPGESLPAGDLCDYANHADASTQYRWRNIACRDGFAASTRAVGRYKANTFGLYDIQGNVYEWVQGCYDNSYKNLPPDGSAQLKIGCDRRVMKGGSWYNAPINLRPSNRSKNTPKAKLSNLGFRVVLELGDQAP